MKTKRSMMLLGILLCSLYLFWGMTPANATYVFYRRSTRLVAVIFASYLVNIATIYFQSMTHNRILTPSLLGFDRLYLLIHIVLLCLVKRSLSSTVVFLIVVVTMTLVSLLIYSSVLKVMKQDLFVLLLVGTVLSTLFSSMSATLQMMMDPNEFSIVQNQGFASFNSIQVSVLGLSILISIFGLMLLKPLRNKVDVVALGADAATNLGVNLHLFQFQALMMIAIFIAITTALVGPISFIGLLSTNIARETTDDYRAKILIHYGTFISVMILVSAQLLFEQVFHLNTAISVVINIIGGIYFIYLMIKERF